MDQDLSAWRAMCELRSQLEQFAAKHAAMRCQSEAAGPQRRKLERHAKRLERIAGKPQLAQHIHHFHEADWQLHRCVVEVAQVRGLKQAWESVAVGLAEFSRMTLGTYWPDLQSLAVEHRFLVDAITAGDVFASQQCAAAHLEGIWYRIEEASDGETNSGHTANPIQRACAYIAIHYMRPIRLQDLASDVAGVCPGHLTRLFKENFGYGFKAYLIKMRLERAQELLRQSCLPISDIAERVGYTDASRFTKHFKEHFMCTPRQFRDGG